jgi:hypothetical protein
VRWKAVFYYGVVNVFLSMLSTFVVRSENNSVELFLSFTKIGAGNGVLFLCA